MAKDANKQLTPEQLKAEQERLAREKKEEEELKKKHAEKVKKRKEKIARKKKEHKKETQRVKSLINLPFKLLLQISVLITTLCFITLFFGMSKDIGSTVLYSFFVFVLLYVGIGSIMVGMFFLVSEDKIVEMEELKKLEKERMLIEKSKEEEELAHMIELEKEIASKRLAGKSLREESPEIFFQGNDDSNNSELDYISSSYISKDGSSNLNEDDIDLNEQQFMDFAERDLNPFNEIEVDDEDDDNQNLLELESKKDDSEQFGFDNFEFDQERVKTR
ncbi:MAG: hypothetical protein NTW25_11970 [Candidatus Kapabacteria bacterium]|nr:hypothetical protein [Candidatus Kapabacteria bacterium]